MVKLIFFALTLIFSATLFAQSKSDTPPFGRNFSAIKSENLGKQPDPNYVMSFPKDHYSHADFDIEWWYLTANLEDQAGNAYGLQWTLFRFRNPAVSKEQATAEDKKQNNLGNTWNNQDIYMAHASVHSSDKHWFSEKLARGNVGNAGIQQSPFKLFIDEWHWSNNASEKDLKQQQGLLPATLSFNAKLINSEKSAPSSQQLEVALTLNQTGPFIRQGDEGYSIKSANGQHASHYYSAPFIQAEGQLSFTHDDINKLDSNAPEMAKPDALDHSNLNSNNDKQIQVKGPAWFDQEWTSQLFDSATLGWDWLSLHLNNGDKIMAFQMRLDGQSDYITGTYINADGASQTLLPDDISLVAIDNTKVGNKTLPLVWALEIPSRRVSVNIKSTKDDQWNPALVAYYEGTVAVSGSHSGKGFLELTGY